VRKQVHRSEVMELIAKVRASVMDSREVREFLEDYHQDPGTPERALPKALSDYYAGVTNGYLSEIYEALAGTHAEVIGETLALLPCPCCHLRTLHELFNAANGTGYDVRLYCRWEDDGTSDPSARSGANSGSMEDYRRRLASSPNYFYRASWIVDEW